MGAVVPHRRASAVCPRRAGPSREGVSFQTQAGAAHVTGVQRLHREERGLCCREGPSREAERAQLGPRRSSEKGVGPAVRPSPLRACGSSQGGRRGSSKF